MKLFTYSFENFYLQLRTVSTNWELPDWQLQVLKSVVENSIVTCQNTYQHPVSVIWYRNGMRLKTAFIRGLDRDEIQAFATEIISLAEWVEVRTINPDGTPIAMDAVA